MEKDGLSCYPKCHKSNYKGWGATCYKKCPKNWTDNGFNCTKPEGYIRGIGYWDEEKCKSAWKGHTAPYAEGHTPPSQVTCTNADDALGYWYPKANPGFWCALTICTALCPKGMTDMGLLCDKALSSRPRGTP